MYLNTNTKYSILYFKYTKLGHIIKIPISLSKSITIDVSKIALAPNTIPVLCRFVVNFVRAGQVNTKPHVKN